MKADEIIRALTRAVILEDLATLKQWMLKSYNPVERELAKLDIVPVGRGNRGESEIGSGLFNRVHEVLYKGKRAAARYSSRPEELEGLLRFVSHREKLPAKFRKHFPKIYKTFQFVDGSITYSGAVLELLEPMPPGLEFDIDRLQLRNSLQRSRVALLDRPGVMKDLLGKIPAKKELQAFFKDELKPLIHSLIGQSLDDTDEALVKLSDEKDAATSTHFYSLFVGNVWNVLRGEVIPSSGNDSKESILASKHQSKAVRDFYKFLQALKASGLQWEDLHTGNFMVRPGTNDFVVVDPGMFEDVSKPKTYEDF